jgi:hypothetical protein
VPEGTLSPDDLLKLSISELIDHRPVAVDFSTRYSVPLSTYGMIQRGICYQLEKNPSILYPPDLPVWSLYANRGVNSDMFFRDLDTGKAILIYANAHMESAETLFRIGRAGEARMELRLAESIAPDLHDQIAQIQRNNNLK